MKNHSSIMLSQKTLVSRDTKVRLRYPKISDTFEHSINDHSMSEKNEKCQHSGSTSMSKNITNHTIIQPRKISFTQRIVPQLRCLRKLLFHETEKFVFAILKLLTPPNIASMIIECQRKMTPANILVQPPGLKTAQIIQYSNQESQNSLT